MVDPDEFIRDLQGMVAWQAQLASAPAELQLGTLRVDAMGISSRVLPEVSRVVAEMTNMIMTIVTRGCQKLQGLCADAIAALQQRPTQLGEFAEFIRSMAAHYSEVS